MTLNDYRTAMSSESYSAWFNENAWYRVTIAGAEFPCVKVTKGKVALSDGTLIQIDDRNKLTRIDLLELQHLTESRFLSIYQNLYPEDRLSVDTFLEALDRKTAVQREALGAIKPTAAPVSQADMPEQQNTNAHVTTKTIEKEDDWHSYRCSFCGKKADDVNKLFAGSNGVYICDECVELCDEILKEEK